MLLQIDVLECLMNDILPYNHNLYLIFTNFVQVLGSLFYDRSKIIFKYLPILKNTLNFYFKTLMHVPTLKELG